jgi:mRNA-degrading endonuclease RelE of RelBE toxin-antitoxin system
MYEIKFTAQALNQLKGFRKYEQQQILTAIETSLKQQPNIPTQNRKNLRPNPLSEWELRIDKFRVFYDLNLEDLVVKIKAVGYKQGNVLYIQGEECQL